MERSDSADGIATDLMLDRDTDIDALLGPPALLQGEDLQSYESLRGRLRCSVTPKDVIEEIWVRDFVDLLWDVLRLRRLKVKLLDASAYKGLESLLAPLVENFSRRASLARSWANREPIAMKEVNELLASGGLDSESVLSAALSFKIDDIERIDRMIAIAESRRNAALREIDRHRDALARRLRDVSADIQDAEFEEVAAADRGGASS